MNDKDNINSDVDDGAEITEEVLGSEKAIFTCGNCGQISQDEVVFKCNTCESEELIHKEGVYMCPKCLLPGENFECMSCGGTDVTLTFPE